MKVKNISLKLLSAGLILTLCLSSVVFAAPEKETETAAADASEKVLGAEAADAKQVMITNNTGKDIEFFAVNPYNPDPMAGNTVYQMQEVLIKEGFLDDVADGSAGPKTQEAISAYRVSKGLSADGGADEELLVMLLGEGYDGNLLTKDDLFAAGETRTLYIPSAKEEKAQTEDAAKDPVAQCLKEFSLEPQFVVTFREKGQEKLYELYVFPADTMKTTQLNLDGDIAYISYTAGDVQEPVSTLDAEKAVAAALTPAPAPAQDTGYTDTGYDTGYDSGYDAGYDYSYDTAYEEPAPVSSERYIVYEEYYPSCDDGSHGMHYIEWSDGSTSWIEY